MEQIFSKKNLQWATIISLILLVSGLWIFYQIKHQSEINKAFQHLEQNTAFKSQIVERCFFERKADVKVFAQRPLFAKSLYENKQIEGTSKKIILEQMQKVKEEYQYGNISITDTAGTLLFSTKDVEQLNDHTIQLVHRAVQSKQTKQSTIVIDKQNQHHLDFIAPIIHKIDGQDIVVGSAIFHMNPITTLFPVLNNWQINYQSAKTGLFENIDGTLMRLNIKSEADKKKLTRTSVQARLALINKRIQKGQTQGRFDNFLDHNDDNNLIYYQVIPNTEWFLASRVHRSEVLTPVYYQILWMGLVGMLFIGLIYFLILRIQDKIQLKIKSTYADELQKSQTYYLGLFMDAPVPYQSLNNEGLIQNVNKAWTNLFGYSEAEVVGKHFKEFITDKSFQNMQSNFPILLDKGAVKDIEFVILTKSGDQREVILEGRISNHDDQDKLRTHCTLIDITDKKQKDSELKLAGSVIENLGEGIMVTDDKCRIISVNQAFESILGFTADEIIGKTPRVLRSGLHEQTFYEKMWDEINQCGFWQGEIWNRRKTGELVAELLTISCLKTESGEVDKYLGVFADISQIKKSQQELDYLAHHDALTGLPNRRKFLNGIEFSINHAKREHYQFAVLVMDLDLFKTVNDSFGHQYGDEVLVEIGSRLKAHLREIDLLSRLGGDEFVLLLDDIDNEDTPARIASKLIQTVKQPIELSNGSKIQVSASFGISIYPEHGETAEALFQHADSALYLAKQQGRSGYEYYSSELTQKAKDRILIENELRSAVANDDLMVYFQPQINIKTGKMVCAEALVRWQHPEMGVVSPAHFIPVAEESNLIIEVGNWVLYETCRQAKEWLDKGYSHSRFAVNVSAKQVMHGNLYETVIQVLKETQLPPEMLELEITESGLVKLGEDSTKLFEQLRALGISIAIDDFGTGYSSLAYLQKLTIDVLKIDKKFVDAIPNDEKGIQIVNAIISMGQNLKLNIIAEGVESESQLNFLKLKGCDIYQGYLMSQPINAESFEKHFLQG